MKEKRISVFNLRFVLIFVVMFMSLCLREASARYRPGLQWRTVSDDHVTIYYPEGHEAFARRILALSGEVYSDVTGYLGVKPRRVPIVLNHDTDLFNGFYQPFPNQISLFETPASYLKGFGSSLDDLADLVYTHEYAHFVHITTRRGLWGALTRVMGDGLAVTNAVSPGWVIEGVTTTLETQFTTGGRGRSPLFRSTVLDFARSGELWSMSASGADSPFGPPPGRIYHSGLYMVEYLNQTYGDDAFARLSLFQAAHPLRGTGHALRQVTGKSHHAFYREYRAHVQSMADSLSRAADSKGLPGGRVVFPAGLDGCIGHFWTGSGTIKAIRKGYDKNTALVEINPTTGAVVTETPTGALYLHAPVRSLPDGRLVFGGLFFHPLGGGTIDAADLVVFDPARKKHEQLTHGVHIFSADLSPDGARFAAVQRSGMWSSLVLIPDGLGDRDGSSITKLISKPGMYFESPRWSPDGNSIAVTVKIGSYTDIALVDPVSGEMRLLFAPDVYGDGDPSFSPDGRWLVFTSSRDGVWNIHAWDLIHEQLYQLTSVFTAALEPLVSPDGAMLSFLVSSKSLNEIRVMPFEPAHGKRIEVGAAGKLPEPDLARLAPDSGVQSGNVPLWEAYKPFIHTPFAESDEDGLSAGILCVGGDPLHKNTYIGQCLYGLESHRPAYDITLINTSFWPEFDVRVYDSAMNYRLLERSDKFWFRERGGEFSTRMDVIHRAVPSLILSSFAAGMRLRKFSSLDDAVVIGSGRDMAGSLFGEFTIMRTPDYAPRDMVPGWGQFLYLRREEGAMLLGNEFPGHNQAVVARQYIPSLLNHHGLSLSLYHQQQSGMLRFSNWGLIPRGYDTSDEEGGFNLRKTLSFSLEYRFPLVFLDRGFGVNLIHCNRLAGSLYLDHGAGWRGSFDAGSWGRAARTSVGLTATARFFLFSAVPVEFGAGAGYKTREKEVFTHIVLETPIDEIMGIQQLRDSGYARPLRRFLQKKYGDSYYSLL